MKEHPKVLIAILARDKEASPSLYLECIKNMDYANVKINSFSYKIRHDFC